MSNLENPTRGIRNNNPFNIVRTGDHWQGQIRSTDRFVKFRSLDYGIRAGINLLRTYIIRGYDTPKKIISRYAPPSENNTAEYLEFVLQVVHVSEDSKVVLNSLTFYHLCEAICWYESRYKLDYNYYLEVCHRFRIL